MPKDDPEFSHSPRPGEFGSCLRKIVFDTRKKAVDAAQRLQRRCQKPLEVYKCRFCPGWHLTSKHSKPRRSNLPRCSDSCKRRDRDVI